MITKIILGIIAILYFAVNIYTAVSYEVFKRGVNRIIK